MDNEFNSGLYPHRTIIIGKRGSHPDDIAVSSGQVPIDLKLVTPLGPRKVRRYQ